MMRKALLEVNITAPILGRIEHHHWLVDKAMQDDLSKEGVYIYVE